MLIDEQNVDQVITTIRTLHQTTIDQRLVNLTDYLLEFFQSIEQQSDVPSVLPRLTKLLRDYDDRAALKIEFLKANCLETIDRLLQNQTANEENVVSILQFVAELLVNSENAQEKFLDYNGYEQIFQCLQHVQSPSVEFIDQLLVLMTDSSTLQIDQSVAFLDQFVHLINPHIAASLIRWLPHLTNPSHRHHIIHSIHVLVSRSVQNKMMACSKGVISSLLDTLSDKDASATIDDKILLDTMFSILEKLSRFSSDTDDIRRVARLFLERTPFSKQLLRVLITAAKHDDPDTHGISSYFDLQRLNSVREVAPHLVLRCTCLISRALFYQPFVDGHRSRRRRCISPFIAG